MFKKYFRYLKFKNKFCIDINRTPSNTILVSGTGRSGTTWLGDVVAYATRSKTIFEPFLLDDNFDFGFVVKKNLQFEDMKKNCSLYLSPTTDKSIRYHKQLEQIITGRVRSSWTDKQKRNGIFLKRVIKGIRSNLLLGYIGRCWPNLPILLIIRDPVAVVDSMFKKAAEGWVFGFSSEEVFSQYDLVHEHLAPYKEEISRAREPVELLTHRWAIENLVPLNQIKQIPNIIVIRYDKLLNGNAEWNRVAEFLAPWGWREDRYIKIVDKPTFTVDNDFGKDAQYIFKSCEIEKIKNIVKFYGLEKYICS
ncbi:MAG: hypothetical protein SVO01_12085 [Thermotogota bacterium]|nr:hypothetical protein [Thermotogota bacterium]